MQHIVRSPSNLITDYVHIAGVGSAFLNSGLLTLSSLFLLRKHKHHFCSLTVSVIMMLSGFSFLEKHCQFSPNHSRLPDLFEDSSFRKTGFTSNGPVKYMSFTYCQYDL